MTNWNSHNEWAEFEAWVAQIATELSGRNGDWTAEFPENKGYAINAWLNGEGGARIALGYDKAKQRVRLHPCWPREMGNATRTPDIRTITVAAFKSGAANDIERRFLPGYLPALAGVHAAIEDAQRMADQASTVLGQLIEASQGVLASDNPAYPREARLTGATHYYGMAVVSYDGEHVSLELRNLKPQVALELVELLGKLR